MLFQLSYAPISIKMISTVYPGNPDIPVWWAYVDSNHRPHAYQACALTN